MAEEHDADHWEATIAEASELLARFSVPLYYDDDQRRPVLFGTGFFITKSDAHFLVSAAHVLDQALRTGLYFYSCPDKKCHIYGTLFRTSSIEKRSADPADIAVVLLHEEIRPPFREVDKFAVDVSYLKPQHLPRTGKHYIINGFPAKKSEVDRDRMTVTVSPYAYRSDPANEADYARMGLAPESHIILPLDRKRGRDPKGRIAHFPKPKGMSGSPIFVLYEEKGDARVFPLVGVGIEYHEPKKLLIGTDISVPMEIIDRAV